jgi:hypothetical protein
LNSPGDFRARAWYARCAAGPACRASGELGGSLPAIDEIQIVTLPAGVAIDLANPIPEPRLLANGVELLGWEDGPAWTLIWRVGYIPPAADYHFFNHAAAAQADGAGYPARYWRDGDRVISFFDLDSGGGPVRVGMYEYPSVTNVPVMDAAGNPYSDAVTVTP